MRTDIKLYVIYDIKNYIFCYYNIYFSVDVFMIIMIISIVVI